MTPTQFLDNIASLEISATFNPYRHYCADFDVEDAPSIRLKNLRQVLFAAIDQEVDVLWVARDLGYRGGRRTGLALTDEAHLAQHASFYDGISLKRSTRGPIVSERTASVIWKMLSRMDRPVFLWNVFPFHPHETSNSQTNRCHTRAEAAACEHLFFWLLEHLNPKIVVGLGLDAQAALDRMSISHIKARHPSYGGKTEFENAIENAFQLESKQKNGPNRNLELNF